MAVALDVSDGRREDGLGDGDAVDGDERLDVSFEDVRRRGEGVGGRRQAWYALLPKKTVSGHCAKDIARLTTSRLDACGSSTSLSPPESSPVVALAESDAEWRYSASSSELFTKAADLMTLVCFFFFFGEADEIGLVHVDAFGA